MDELRLRPIEAGDTDNILKWRNSPAVYNNLYTRDELTREQHLDWLKTRVETGLCRQYIIEVENLPVGTVFIKNIDRQSQKGEFGIFIGEKQARGKGYASVATQKILETAFSELELNRVYLTVFADNIPGIKAYLKAGFLAEGILKQDFLRPDGFVDIVVMGITKRDWKDV